MNNHFHAKVNIGMIKIIFMCILWKRVCVRKVRDRAKGHEVTETFVMMRFMWLYI